MSEILANVAFASPRYVTWYFQGVGWEVCFGGLASLKDIILQSSICVVLLVSGKTFIQFSGQFPRVYILSFHHLSSVGSPLILR